MKRILVIPPRFIGDAILTVPLLRGLKVLYPKVPVDLMIPAYMANLFELCPYINEIVTEPNGIEPFIQTVKKNQYDTVILLRQSITQAMLLRIADVETVIGYDRQRLPDPIGFRRTAWFISKVMKFPPIDTDIPQVKTYMAPLEKLGYFNANERLELWADTSDEAAVDKLFAISGLDPDRPLAVLHATSASRAKKMRPEQFTRVLEKMNELGYQVIALGTESDADFYDTLSKKADSPIFNFCGQTTLRQSYALHKRIQLLFSLDSAPIHMAVAANIPNLVVIYGPTNREQWRPYPYSGHFTPVYKDNGTRKCLPKDCPHQGCVLDIPQKMMTDALLLHSVNTPARI